MKKNFNLKKFLVENKLTEASRGKKQRVHFNGVQLSDKVHLISEVKEPLEELDWRTKEAAHAKAAVDLQDPSLSPGKRAIRKQQYTATATDDFDRLAQYGINVDKLLDRVDYVDLNQYMKGVAVPAVENALSRRELKALDRYIEDKKEFPHASYNHKTGKWENNILGRPLEEGDFDNFDDSWGDPIYDDTGEYVVDDTERFEECDLAEQSLEEAGYVADDDFYGDDDFGVAHGTDDIPYDARAAKAASKDIASDTTEDEEESFEDPEDIDDPEEDEPEEAAGGVNLSDLQYDPDLVTFDEDFNIQEYVSQWPEDKWPVILRVLQQGLNQAQKEANENGGIWKRGLYMYRCSRTDSYKQGGYNTRDYKTSVSNPEGRGDFIQMIAKIKPDPKALKDLGWD